MRLGRAVAAMWYDRSQLYVGGYFEETKLHTKYISVRRDSAAVRWATQTS